MYLVQYTRLGILRDFNTSAKIQIFKRDLEDIVKFQIGVVTLHLLIEFV